MGTLTPLSVAVLHIISSLRSQADLDFSRLPSGIHPRQFSIWPSAGRMRVCELHEIGAVSGSLWV